MLRIVADTKILNAHRGTYGMILAGYMIGYEINDHLQSCLMCTLHKLLKFLHTSININGQVRINVVVVGNGIRRTGLALNNGSMLAGNTILGIVRLRGMTDNARIPHMTDTHRS